MARIRLTELSKDVRAFVLKALEDGGVTIEDAHGRTRGGIIPYRDASADEKRLAKKAEKVAAEQAIGQIDFVLLVDE